MEKIKDGFVQEEIKDELNKNGYHFIMAFYNSKSFVYKKFYGDATYLIHVCYINYNMYYNMPVFKYEIRYKLHSYSIDSQQELDIENFESNANKLLDTFKKFK